MAARQNHSRSKFPMISRWTREQIHRNWNKAMVENNCRFIRHEIRFTNAYGFTTSEISKNACDTHTITMAVSRNPRWYSISQCTWVTPKWNSENVYDIHAITIAVSHNEFQGTKAHKRKCRKSPGINTMAIALLCIPCWNSIRMHPNVTWNSMTQT